MNNTELNEQLRALRQTLPHGSFFQYRLAPDSLYIEKLTIPGHVRGVGSQFMERVLAAADAAELPVELHARSTGRATDPTDSALQSWYARLGFEPLEEEDEGLFMHRSVRRSEEPVTWDGGFPTETVADAIVPTLQTTPEARVRRRRPS